MIQNKLRVKLIINKVKFTESGFGLTELVKFQFILCNRSIVKYLKKQIVIISINFCGDPFFVIHCIFLRFISDVKVEVRQSIMQFSVPVFDVSGYFIQVASLSKGFENSIKIKVRPVKWLLLLHTYQVSSKEYYLVSSS